MTFQVLEDKEYNFLDLLVDDNNLLKLKAEHGSNILGTQIYHM